MAEDELHALIIDRLAAAFNPDDIVMEICDRYGLTWPEAESMVNQIQTEHESTVTRRQFPLLAILAVGLFLVGVALIVYSTYSLAGIIDYYSQVNLSYTAMPGIVVFIFEYASGTLGMLGLGMAIVLGSLMGMRRVWSAILNN